MRRQGAIAEGLRDTFRFRGRMARGPYLRFLLASILVWLLAFAGLQAVGVSDRAAFWIITVILVLIGLSSLKLR